jgi:hypothetical protein
MNGSLKKIIDQIKILFYFAFLKEKKIKRWTDSGLTKNITHRCRKILRVMKVILCRQHPAPPANFQSMVKIAMVAFNHLPLLEIVAKDAQPEKKLAMLTAVLLLLLEKTNTVTQSSTQASRKAKKSTRRLPTKQVRKSTKSLPHHL